MDNHNDGEKIKRIREHLNYTQDYMAHELGISQTAYGRLESGQIKMTTDYLYKLEVIFKISINDILNINLKNILNNFKAPIVVDTAESKNADKTIIELYKKLLKAMDEIAALKK